MLVGGEGAFVPAARQLAHFTGVTMSPSTVRRVTLAAGTAMRQLELAFTATVRATGTVPDPPPDVPLQLSVDGSLVHLREEGWREVKVVALGERQVAGKSLAALTYAATLGTAGAFGDEALGELGRRGIPQATDVVTVNDGAVWIQDFLDLHCPQAHRVLDFAHAAGYLATAATEAFGEASPEGIAWYQAQRRILRDGDPDQVLATLRSLPDGEARDTALGYLSTRRGQIAYRDVVVQGWPIGSGCVESAHKELVQRRLKGRGMRWSRATVEGVLALRVVLANDRWDQTWTQVASRQRAERQARTASRRVTRHTRPPRATPGRDGKPAADHPWRRFRLPGTPRFTERSVP